MTNAERIEVLRYCGADKGCLGCPLDGIALTDCFLQVMIDAADALEEAEKRINELTTKCSQLQGEWIPSMCTHPDGTTEQDVDEWYGELYECSICHYRMIGEENYCPNCGARMRIVTDCHTLDEGER